MAEISPSDLTPIALGAFVFLALLGLRASPARRPSGPAYRPRTCRACMADHPAFANYCRRCGRHLPQ